ncbi:helix-turn-helix transcriptional regulator [Spiractinospora alimapuensis]|uniref:helix-turn-helix transcriptional regulator n=1 Tax=Spiractinospora alimapuensis TaxID=2820884 RepID=UPI001F173A1F|nr:helix-turn-helix transcriptional regulator [Spiractinospora alimapuensis]
MAHSNRGELAAFLRTRRHRLQPFDVGLPEVGPRRTPGLRRQEVAQLAGMSIDYYIRLEQGRGPTPSAQVLAALTRALLLSMDERDYLFRLVGENPPITRSPTQDVPNAVRILLDNLTNTPAYVLDAKYDVLAWNHLATYFTGDLENVSPERRNVLRWIFRPGDDGAARREDPDARSFARSCVADLRAAHAQYPGDAGIRRLVDELRASSPDFADIWAAHEVEVRRRVRKRVVHPAEGELRFECQVMHIPESDQRLIAYCAEPGSPTEAVFRRLAAMPRPDTPTLSDGRYQCEPGAVPSENVQVVGLQQP